MLFFFLFSSAKFFFNISVVSPMWFFFVSLVGYFFRSLVYLYLVLYLSFHRFLLLYFLICLSFYLFISEFYRWLETGLKVSCFSLLFLVSIAYYFDSYVVVVVKIIFKKIKNKSWQKYWKRPHFALSVVSSWENLLFSMFLFAFLSDKRER